VKITPTYTNFEVEDPERLKISFSSPIYVQYFDLTDLYYEDSYEEMGSWSLDNTNRSYRDKEEV
jgi:hypothetical protein